MYFVIITNSVVRFQILKQFPLAFEFNHFYIKFLAYHSISARFRTFLVDTEYERVTYGFMALEDKRGSLPRHYKGVDTGSDDDSFIGELFYGSLWIKLSIGKNVDLTGIFFLQPNNWGLTVIKVTWECQFSTISTKFMPKHRYSSTSCTTRSVTFR